MPSGDVSLKSHVIILSGCFEPNSKLQTHNLDLSSKDAGGLLYFDRSMSTTYAHLWKLQSNHVLSPRIFERCSKHVCRLTGKHHFTCRCWLNFDRSWRGEKIIIWADAIELVWWTWQSTLTLTVTLSIWKFSGALFRAMCKGKNLHLVDSYFSCNWSIWCVFLNPQRCKPKL